MTENPFRQPRYPETKCLHLSRKQHECPAERKPFGFFCDRHEYLHSKEQDYEISTTWRRQKYEFQEQLHPGEFFKKAEEDFIMAIRLALGSEYDVIDKDIYYDTATGIAEFPDGTKYKISLVRIAE